MQQETLLVFLRCHQQEPQMAARALAIIFLFLVGTGRLGQGWGGEEGQTGFPGSHPTTSTYMSPATPSPREAR